MDATNIERNLYLTIQLLELGVPVVLALNMMDEAAKQGMTIDIERLSQRLGFPVMATVARTGEGLPELLKATEAYIETKRGEPWEPLHISYGPDLDPVLRDMEAAIAEAAFREGYIVPIQPQRNGKKVAVIGAGPAGLSVAVRLNARGYEVTLFDSKPMPGGLLRYGIPNFKLDKAVIDRRMKILEAEGIRFEMGVHIDVQKLPEGFDAYAICTGTPQARDLSIPGRELKGIYFALEQLAQQNHILDGDVFPKDQLVNAKGKRVLVIGGGDTGSDCIGTSIRQGATSVTQIEIMPQPPIGHNPATPWPQWPVVLKTTSSHEEGCTRRWSLASNRFIGKNGKVCGVEVEEVEWIPASDGGRSTMKPTGKTEIIDADMVLLAMGFLKPEQPKFAENVFVAGDAAMGASLVVRALADGRKVAAAIDDYLNK